MGQYFSLHNCNVMHYNSKLVCNGNYISITFELHFHMVTFLHTLLQIKNALSLHLSSDTEFISSICINNASFVESKCPCTHFYQSISLLSVQFYLLNVLWYMHQESACLLPKDLFFSSVRSLLT